MKITFKKAVAGDYPFLREMMYEALYVPEGEKPYAKTVIDLPEIARYIERWGRRGDVGVIALDGDRPIGAAWGRLFTAENKGFGFVNEGTPEIAMAVRRQYRNRGVGSRLLTALVAAARRRGFRALSLSVDKKNRAFEFYRRLGFEIAADAGTAYTMRRELNADTTT